MPGGEPVTATPSRMRRRIGIVLIYAVLGPPIGMLGLMLVAAGANAIEKGHYAQILMAPLLVFSPLVLFAYVFGGIPAVATGLIMASLDRVDRFWKYLTISVCVGAASSLAWQSLFLGGAGRQDPLLLPFVGSFSAIVCALLHRVLSARQGCNQKPNENRQSR